MSSKLKRFFVVLVIALIIFSILGVSNYFIGKKVKKIEGVLPKFPELKLPQEFPKVENFKDLKDINKFFESFKAQKIEKKEFVSEDKKLKLEYTSEWFEIEPEKAETFFSEETLKKYNGKVLFFGEKFGFGNISVLCVQEILVEREMGVDEIIEEMKKNAKEQGRTMEILEIEKKDNEVIFEAKYKNKYETHTKEKILLLEPENSQRKIFLIVYMTLEGNWESLKNDAEKIINSARLLE